MSTTKIITQLIVHTKTHAEWAASDPIIPIGEAARASDVNSHLLRKGDGKTKWSQLQDYDPNVTTAPHAASHMLGGRDPIKLGDLGGAPGYQVQYTIPNVVGWYRIATSIGSNTKVLNSIFSIVDTVLVGGYHTAVNISTSLTYMTYPSLSQLSCSLWKSPSCTKIRIVYNDSSYDNPSYLEIYHTVTAADGTLSIAQFGALDYNWKLLTEATKVNDTVPSGYTSKEITLQPGVGVANMAELLRTPRDISIAGEVNADAIEFNGSTDITLQGYLNLLYSATRDYEKPTIVIGSDSNAYLWIKANGPGTTNGAKNPVTAGNTAYWKKIGGSLSITRTQSAANERTAVISKNKNYTVPSYIVGKNNLSVYIGGLKGLVGTDVNKHLYKEVGSSGATSTTIQFLDDIPIEHDLIFEVINVS